MDGRIAIVGIARVGAARVGATRVYIPPGPGPIPVENLLFAIVGIARVGATRVGYCSTGFLCQVGKRTLPARVGATRVGATRVGATVLYSALRYLEQSSFQLSDSGFTEPPSCSFTIICQDEDIRPRVGELVVIAVSTLRRRLFGGNLAVIEESREYAGSGRSVYRCQAFGFLRRLQRVAIFASYSAKLAGDILRELFAAHTPLFDITLIEDGPLLSNQIFDGISLLEVCNTIAAQAEYLFYIDSLRRVIFRPLSAMTAPWRLTDDSASAITLTDDDDDLITRHTVRYSTPERRVQQILGDGETKEFPLYGTIADVHGMQVNGSDVTFGWRYEEDNSDNDFSVRGANPAYIATVKHATLAPGQRLSVDYTSLFPARLTVTDRAHVILRQSAEGGTGLYDRVDTNRDFRVNDALASTTATLRQTSDSGTIVAYTRIEPLASYYSNLLRVGQLQPVQVHTHDMVCMIQELRLSVLRPADDLTAMLQVEVRLGRKIYTLTDLFKTIAASPDAPANERVSERVI